MIYDPAMAWTMASVPLAAVIWLMLLQYLVERRNRNALARIARIKRAINRG